MRVVSEWGLGYHENNPCFSAEQPRRRSGRITSCNSGSSDMPPGTQREQICHCQTIPAFCFPSLPPAARLFTFTMCAPGSQEAMSYRGSVSLRRITSLPVSRTTAARFRRLPPPPTFLSSVLGIHSQIKLSEEMPLSNSTGKCFLKQTHMQRTKQLEVRTCS